MNDFQLPDGIVFISPKDELATARSLPAIILDLLPPCACGAPSDEALLRSIYVLLDSEFPGVRELKGNEPSTAVSLALAYLDQPSMPHLPLSIDPSSIEGMALITLLSEIKNGTSRSSTDLAAHAIHAIEMAYTHAGRADEFAAAMQRWLEKQQTEGTMQ